MCRLFVIGRNPAAQFTQRAALSVDKKS